MENIEKLSKMIETLAKFAREGRDTEASRRLARLLKQIDQRDEAALAPVVRRQSMAACIEAASVLISAQAKAALQRSLCKPPTSLSQEVAGTEWQEDI